MAGVNQAGMAVNDGDWVEGTPKWWWKYVFPTFDTFYLAVLREQGIGGQDPVPLPWLQRVTGEVLEGVVMLHAAAHADQAASERLRSEAAAKIRQAVTGIQQAELTR